MNYLALFLLSTMLVLTACGGDESSSHLPAYDDGKDIELTEKMIERIANPHLALGYNHSCFILSNENVSCWGSNQYGQLGHGNKTKEEIEKELLERRKNGDVITEEEIEAEQNKLSSSTPVKVKDSNGVMTGAIKISAGENHTCALLAGGNVKCWGNNSDRQLGNAELSTQGKKASSTAVDVNVADLQGVKAISVGNTYSCALLEAGDIKCWGKIPSGFSANNLLELTNKKPSQLATASAHACVVTEDNQVQCWGDSSKLGHSESEATEVTGIDNALFVSSKGSHSCALLNNGRVRCWGSNLRGQIGNGDGGSITSTVTIPSKNVINLSQVVSLSSGENYNCAVTQLGQVKCWGNNDNGQLGFTSTGSYKQQFYPQVAASGISTAEEVSVSQNHSCARLKNDDVYCWGKNDRGQLGNGQLGNGEKLSDGSSNLSTLSTPVKVQL